MEEKKKGLIGEFREFIMRGNVVDMAVGVIIATAFGKITTSLVQDLFMPAIGWLIGGIDLSGMNIVLSEAVVLDGVETAPAVVLGIGTFLAVVIDFVLIALVIFLMLKTINGARNKLEEKNKKEAEAAVEVTEEVAISSEQLLAEILEELKKK